METALSVLWVALVLPDGEAGVATLSSSGQALEFLKDQYRHCKPILVPGAAQRLLVVVGIPPKLPRGEPDAALIQSEAIKAESVAAFVGLVASHRHFERESDPPAI